MNVAINQMDQVTQKNAAMVEESTAASQALANETAELVRLTERFQIGDPATASATNVQPLHRPGKLPQGVTTTSMFEAADRSSTLRAMPAVNYAD